MPKKTTAKAAKKPASKTSRQDTARKNADKSFSIALDATGLSELKPVKVVKTRA
ncbi:MAG: hypothetical protein ABSF34_21570 [Verrucomicrobiota bacterium]